MTAVEVDLRPRNRWLYAGIAALLAAAIGIQVVRDRGWQAYEPPNPLLWVQPGPIVSRLVLGFDNLVADVYWIRTIVYYGGKRRSDAATKDYQTLYPLLDLVTTLDPHFRVAYRFGAIFLTESYPSGPGRPDQAVRLLTRAIERDLGRWEYFHDIGFIYYWWLRDYQQASDWFLRASGRPDAPSWLRPLAATTLAVGGNFESSRLIWQQLANSDVEYIRAQARHRLAQLDAAEAIAELTPVLRAFVDREGRLPRTWGELAQLGPLPRVPVDPAGVPFVVDPATGRIDVSRQSLLWPLPSQAQPPPVAVP